MQQLQSELQMAVLMITHDLGIVANMADEVVVMYHGKVMESGTVETSSVMLAIPTSRR